MFRPPLEGFWWYSSDAISRPMCKLSPCVWRSLGVFRSTFRCSERSYNVLKCLQLYLCLFVLADPFAKLLLLVVESKVFESRFPCSRTKKKGIRFAVLCLTTVYYDIFAAVHDHAINDSMTTKQSFGTVGTCMKQAEFWHGHISASRQKHRRLCGGA